MKKNVAVVVLTWNGKALTLDCLDSLTRADYPNLSIIVIDNASSDGTAQAIHERFGDRVTVIRNHTNLGFAAGNNVGIEHALETDAEFVFLLNNDTVVDVHVVDRLAKALETDPEAGVVGPKIYYAAPSDQIWFAGGEVLLHRGVARHVGIRERDTGQYDTLREVDYVTGCALMARRAVFEAIGSLDVAYRAYFEDTDFCMRAHRAGFKILYVPGGVVWHKISASTGGQLSARKITRKLRSSVRFFGKYASIRHWATIPLFFALDVARILILVAAGRIRDTGDVETNREGIEAKR